MSRSNTGADPDSGFVIELSNTQSAVEVDRDWLIALVTRTLQSERISRAEISIALVNDPAIHERNRLHLGHDYPTDVITFPLSEPGTSMLAGDILVSAETAARVAAEGGHHPLEELALYVIHGILHLCGYDDHKEPDIQRMRRRESELLAQVGIGDSSEGDLRLRPESVRERGEQAPVSW
jgi:probable rRNA maturation factor